MNYLFNRINFFLEKKIRLKFFTILTLSLISTFLELIGIATIPMLLTLLITENVLFDKYFSFLKDMNIYLVIFCIGLFFFIKNVYLAFILYLEATFTKDLSVHFSQKLFSHYVNQEYEIFSKYEPSTLTRNLLDDTNNLAVYFSNLTTLIREALVVFFVFIILFYSQPTLSALILIFFFILTLVYFKLIAKYVYNLGVKIFSLRKKQFNLVLEFHDFFDIIKVFSSEKIFSKTFLNFAKDRENSILKTNIIGKLPKILIEIVAIILVLTLITYFLMQGIPISDSLIVLSLLTVIIIRFIPAFNSISSSLSNMKKLQVSVERVYKLLLPNKNPLIKTKFDSLIKLENSKEKLILKDIKFGYEGDFELFNHLNLEINFGKTIAFYGKSGIGKSTLLKIILGLLKSKSGIINFDGKNIYEDQAWWTDNCSYIPQKTFLFNGSIKENITFSKNTNLINEQKLKDVIDQAELKEFLNSFENNVDHQIDYHGKNISGGQAQRISIARALFREPNLLIMDEPTSSLDDKTKSALINKIIGLKNIKIKILCSHNMSDIEKCDQIFEIKDKGIKEIKL